MYMLISSGPFTLKKLMLHSVATALATSVLPVPVPTGRAVSLSVAKFARITSRRYSKTLLQLQYSKR